MPKVSIVIPVYDVENYIERCVRSLFEQTLDDLEFIFVNDCTLDKSLEIIHMIVQEYPNRINQIKIINHEVNKGLAVARKTGIEASTGEYIIQCDSDDWMDINMCNILYSRAKIDDSDVTICGYYVTDLKIYKPYVKGLVTDKKELIRNCLYQKTSASLCTKLFKRSLFDKNIIYPLTAMGEDITLALQLLYQSQRISVINRPLYYYYSNLNSISKNQDIEKVYGRFQQILQNILIMEDFINKNNLAKEYKFALICFKFKQRNILLPLIRYDEYFKIWKNTFAEINILVPLLPITIREKILFFLRFVRLKKK